MGARIAFAPALALWAGTLAGLHWAPPATWPAVLALPAAWIAAFAMRRNDARLAAGAVLVLCTIAGCLLGARHTRTISAERTRIEAGAGLHRLEVRVCGPGARGGELVEVEVRAARPPLVHGTRLRLRMPEGRRAGWGDRMHCLARIEVAPARRNPGGFDARAADFTRGVAGRGRIHSIASHDSTGAASWPRATVVRWRRAIERMLDERLGETARAYAVPLMVGDRSGLAPEQRARIRDAGLAHLLALSGLHVSWLALLARAAAAALGGGLVARAVAGALSALVYMGLAGPLPALARAAVTEVLGAAARATQRAFDPLQALSLSVMALLAWQPGWALDLGFQLSCAATFGLITAAAGSLDAASLWRRRIVAPLRATAAAQLAAAPLLVAAFHGLSWSVWISNLPAVPLAGLLLGLLWAAVLIEWVLPGAAAALWLACDACARGLDAIAAAGAALPFAFIPCGPGGAVVPLAAAGAALLGIARVRQTAPLAPPHPGAAAMRRAGALGAVLTLTALVLALVPAPLVPPAGRAWIVALDVGQGDAIALAFARRWWLVDAGPRAPGYDAGESVVVPFFRWAGVRALEGLIVTHMDADHAGGAAAVWRALDPTRVASPDSGAAALRPRGRRPLRIVAAGDTLHRLPRLTVLWPPAGVAGAKRNERSAVLRLELEGRQVLLTADADSAVEGRLAVAPGADLLKAGHHGARSSSGAGFLARLAPHAAVISAGRTNPFGHPHPETLERLAAAHVRVRRTDLEGAVWYELSAAGLRDIDWRAGGGVAPADPAPRAPMPAARAPRAG